MAVSDEAYTVQCNDTHMDVTFDYDSLVRTDDNNLRAFTLYWEGDFCKHSEVNLSDMKDINHTVTVSAALPNGCGIQETDNGTHILYSQRIIVKYGSNPTDKIIREEYDNYDVMCSLEVNVTAGHIFVPFKREDGTASKDATDVFDVTLKYAASNGFRGDTSSFSVGEKILFTLELDSGVETTQAIVDRCYAVSSPEFELINGCNASDTGTEITKFAKKMTEFTTEAFAINGEVSVIVECKVRVCLTGKSTDCTLCTLGSEAPARKRRDASTQETDEIVTVRSPVFYVIDNGQGTRTNAQSEEASGSFMSTTNGTIIVSLLAILVLVAVAAIVKKAFFSTSPAPTIVTGFENKGMA